MMTKQEVLDWLNGLDEDSNIAIDKNGLCLVEIDQYGEETDEYLEIGLTPDEEDLINAEDDEDG